MTQYHLWLTEPNGDKIKLFTGFSSLTYGRILNDKGSFNVAFPTKIFPRVYFKENRRIEIWRRIPGTSRWHVPFTGLLQVLDQYNQGKGEVIELGGYDLIDILDTRIINASAGSSGASLSDNADDAMKTYVINAIGTGAVAARSRSAYLSVQEYSGKGPIISVAESNAKLLKALQEAAAAAFTAGTPVYFDVVPNDTNVQFRTYVNQLGRDVTDSITLSLERGTLKNPRLRQDWRNQTTYVYAGGRGEKSAREIQTAEDTARSGASIWSRREAFIDARHVDEGNTAQLLDVARQGLFRGRPRREFTGEIVNQKGNEFGVHWDFGYKLVAEYADESYVCDVSAYQIMVKGSGKEDINAKLRYLSS